MCPGIHVEVRGQPSTLGVNLCLLYCLRKCLFLFSTVCKASKPINVRRVSASTSSLSVGVLALQMYTQICRNFHVDSGNRKNTGCQNCMSLLPSSEIVPPQILIDMKIIINNRKSSRCCMQAEGEIGFVSPAF